MKQFLTLPLIVLAALSGVAGCDNAQETKIPDPRELTREATGYYCQMIVEDHPGPKAQIFLADRKDPLWFPSVRDAFAFLMLPGEAKNVVAFYVNDMGRAGDWEHPEPGTWTDGKKAFYVLGSRMKGGMGNRETVPFASKEAASLFVRMHSGQVRRFEDVTPAYIFADDNDVERPVEGGAEALLKQGAEANR